MKTRSRDQDRTAGVGSVKNAVNLPPLALATLIHFRGQ
jgi:hypothetical protein